MERALNPDELRIAARQAITLALSMKDELARNDLLHKAQQLFEEAQGPKATYGEASGNRFA